MRAFFEILSGPQACRRVALPPGQSLKVGRTDDADVALAHDKLLSGAHFALDFDGASCRVRDLGSARGTLLEGDPVSHGEVRDGDTIIAGETWFRVRLRPPPGGELSDDDRRLPDAVVRGVLAALATSATSAPPGAPLFAVLDAARDPGVLALLRDAEVLYQSLYEGMQGQLLSEEAPYLVELGSDPWFDELLVRRGWGRSWGVYLSSREPFREVRRHLRQFLFVKDEADRELYFRFYDPRVLRVFLPTCKARQVQALFTGVEALSMEGAETGELLVFTADAGRAKGQVVTIAAVDEPGNSHASRGGA